MKAQKNKDIFLWMVWCCIFGIFYYLGNKQYHMAHLGYILILMWVISATIVGLCWLFSRPEDGEKTEE